MAGRVELVTLVLLFLAALLVHYLMTAKESFANAPLDVPITKDQLKAELTITFTEFYSDYTRLDKLSQKSDAVKLRLAYLSDTITFLNNTFKSLDTTPLPPSLTVNDVKTCMRYVLSTLDSSYSSSINTPVTVNDLMMFLTKTNEMTEFLRNRVPIVLGGSQSSDILNTVLQYQTAITRSINALINKLSTMRPAEVPLFKADRYSFAVVFSNKNFVIFPTDIPSTIPVPKIDAMSTSGSLSQVLNQTTQPTPGSTNTSQGPGSMKFSELITAITSYGTAISPTEKKQEQPVKKAPEPLPTTTDMNNLKAFVSDEVKAQLSTYKLGPKDIQNATVVDRKTVPVKAETPDASSNALEQGKWFRNENTTACPYASGQQATGDPQPYPIDMNDYIRKDSIPCWGCNLK